MSTLKVNAIRGTGASSNAISVNSTDGTCIVKATNNLGHNNLVIGGSMNVAQRGTSSTTSAGGIKTVDRFGIYINGTDNDMTQEQITLTSSDTGPWAKGFRKALKLTNGNQSGGFAAGDYFFVEQGIEGQNIAQSGWDYTSASSYITLSFWIKSSVAQNFYGYLKSNDGTAQRYAFETGSLSANTWTKITKKIPGNSNVQIDNDNGGGLYLELMYYAGTNLTDSGVSLNTWGAFASGTRTPDNTSTWWTTDDATLAWTGVQLTATDHCPDYPHISYGDELARCQRYYQAAEGTFKWAWDGLYANGAGAGLSIYYTLTPEMRADPTITHNIDDKTNVTSSIITAEKDSLRVGAQCTGSGRTAMTRTGSGYLRLDAEL